MFPPFEQPDDRPTFISQTLENMRASSEKLPGTGETNYFMSELRFHQLWDIMSTDEVEELAQRYSAIPVNDLLHQYNQMKDDDPELADYYLRQNMHPEAVYDPEYDNSTKSMLLGKLKEELFLETGILASQDSVQASVLKRYASDLEEQRRHESGTIMSVLKFPGRIIADVVADELNGSLGEKVLDHALMLGVMSLGGLGGRALGSLASGAGIGLSTTSPFLNLLGETAGAYSFLKAETEYGINPLRKQMGLAPLDVQSYLGLLTFGFGMSMLFKKGRLQYREALQRNFEYMYGNDTFRKYADKSWAYAKATAKNFKTGWDAEEAFYKEPGAEQNKGYNQWTRRDEKTRQKYEKRRQAGRESYKAQQEEFVKRSQEYAERSREYQPGGKEYEKAHKPYMKGTQEYADFEAEFKRKSDEFKNISKDMRAGGKTYDEAEEAYEAWKEALEFDYHKYSVDEMLYTNLKEFDVKMGVADESTFQSIYNAYNGGARDWKTAYKEYEETVRKARDAEYEPLFHPEAKAKFTGAWGSIKKTALNIASETPEASAKAWIGAKNVTKTGLKLGYNYSRAGTLHVYRAIREFLVNRKHKKLTSSFKKLFKKDLYTNLFAKFKKKK